MPSIPSRLAQRARRGHPSQRLLRAIGVVGLLLLAGDPTQTANLSTPEAPPSAYGRLPLMFEANHGQTDDQVQFLARGSGYQVFLTRGAAVLAFKSSATEPRASAGVPLKMQEARPVSDMKQAAVHMTLEGANPDPHAVGLERLPGTVNYLRGNDPDKWPTNVPTYAKVRYEAVYPGIDLVYYGHARQMEYDFIVAPGADPDVITLSFEGADSVDLDAGEVVLTTAAGPVRFRKPVVYQERNGSRQSVAGDYVRKGPERIGFRVADYDTTRSLIIDPVVSYATYLAGGDPGGVAYACDLQILNRESCCAAVPIVDELITMSDPVTSCCIGSDFSITATFTNASGTPISMPFFDVVKLTGGNLLVSGDDGPGGDGATLTPDVVDGLLSPGESVTVTFVIRLMTLDPFRFFVRIRGEIPAT